jgi:hypothetical protein
MNTSVYGMYVDALMGLLTATWIHFFIFIDPLPLEIPRAIVRKR